MIILMTILLFLLTTKFTMHATPQGHGTIKDAAFNASWYGIAYGDGLYVSCGGGRMMYTNDLANPWAQYVYFTSL